MLGQSLLHCVFSFDILICFFALAMNSMIDLRSDTVTKPTHAMRSAMMNAEVGDDVYGEDPTVNALQERIATMFGKEAALWVPTGVMGNQLAIKAHTNDGDEVIVDEESHIYRYETAAPSVLSRVQLRILKTQRGVFNHTDIEQAINPDVYYYATTRLVCMENTQNRYGGAVIPLADIQAIGALAKQHHIAFHLDGARLWNACVATGISPKEYTEPFDSVSVCLSKGLGAPAGSVLVGSKALITKAHKWRKIIGGGMRQVGILAAAGLYALDHHVERLRDDHTRAKLFAEQIHREFPLAIQPADVETNIVVLHTAPYKEPSALIAFCKEHNVIISPWKHGTVRLVFHYDIDDTQTERASEILRAGLR